MNYYLNELAKHGRTICPNRIAGELYKAARKIGLRVHGGIIIEGEHELLRGLYVD